MEKKTAKFYSSKKVERLRKALIKEIIGEIVAIAFYILWVIPNLVKFVVNGGIMAMLGFGPIVVIGLFIATILRLIYNIRSLKDVNAKIKEAKQN